jgi:hypothetical protein
MVANGLKIKHFRTPASSHLRIFPAHKSGQPAMQVDFRTEAEFLQPLLHFCHAAE